jgi:serine O-acetyltransferase
MTKEAEADALWLRLREETRQRAEQEPILASYLHATVLNHRRLEDALSFHLADKLASPHLSAMSLRELLREAFDASEGIRVAIRRDLLAASERDPAARGLAEPFLHYKGYLALQAYRVGHHLWGAGRRALAGYLQHRISEVFTVDIHPAAVIGSGIFLDHASSVVIGETAVVEDDVSMLHEVTLGGTGKLTGDRHPKIRRGVLIGAGAKVLGNLEVGEGSKIAAGSLVLTNVLPHTTVAGIPAVVVGKPSVAQPAFDMDQAVDDRTG